MNGVQVKLGHGLPYRSSAPVLAARVRCWPCALGMAGVARAWLAGAPAGPYTGQVMLQGCPQGE